MFVVIAGFGQQVYVSETEQSKTHPRVGEMLAVQAGDMSLDPRNPGKKPEVLPRVCNPSPGEAEEGPCFSLVSQTKSVSSRLRERTCLNKIKKCN